MVDLSEIWPEWTVEKVLGSGSYGTVYKAVRCDYVKSEAAIKIISVPKTDEGEDLLREEGLMKPAAADRKKQQKSQRQNHCSKFPHVSIHPFLSA